MQSILANWRTTAAGIALILTALGTALTAISDDDPQTVVVLDTLITQLVVGWALIFARDGSVSSEKSGAKS